MQSIIMLREKPDKKFIELKRLSDKLSFLYKLDSIGYLYAFHFLDSKEVHSSFPGIKSQISYCTQIIMQRQVFLTEIGCFIDIFAINSYKKITADVIAKFCRSSSLTKRQVRLEPIVNAKDTVAAVTVALTM